MRLKDGIDPAQDVRHRFDGLPGLGVLCAEDATLRASGEGQEDRKDAVARCLWFRMGKNHGWGIALYCQLVTIRLA